MAGAVESFFNRLWYGNSPLRWAFYPATFLTRVVTRNKRKNALRRPPEGFGVPVVIVGNITVGGTGKTPLIVTLVESLAANGVRAGIVSRGYGGKGPFPLIVSPCMSPARCGDEALLLCRRTGAPVVVAPDRPAAVRLLLQHAEVDVVISDDGLQHYSLGRQYEILVIDGKRGLGNGCLLPMGPLREEGGRLSTVDAIVINGEGQPLLPSGANIFRMQVQAMQPLPLDPAVHRPWNALESMSAPMLAFAGIGHPERFFATLRSAGLTFSTRTFPDHYHYSASDFAQATGQRVIMTEKDAVKCRPEWHTDMWYLPVHATLEPDLARAVMARLGLNALSTRGVP